MSIDVNIDEEKTKKDLYHFERLLQSNGGVNALMYKELMKSSNRYDKDKIMRAINSKDVITLRQVSRYFYYKSGIYRRLVDYLATSSLMYYKVVPRNNERFIDKKFTMFHDLVFEYTESLGMNIFNDISRVVFTEGIFFGYQRKVKDDYTIQQLPTDYCRTLGKYPSGNYVVEFDLKFFNSFKYADKGVDHVEIIKMYPRDIARAWLEYSTGVRESAWYQIPEEFGMCFSIDEIGMPPLTGIFVELIELDNSKKLEKIKTALDLIKIVVQKIPLDKETQQPAYELEEAQAVHNNLINMLSNNDNVDGYTTPFDVSVLNTKDTGESTDKTNAAKAERTVFSEAGITSNLGNSEGNIAMSNSIKSDQAWTSTINNQYENWVDTHINTYISDSRNYNFDFEFLPITWYNQSEWLDKYYQGATIGVSKLEYAIALGVKQAHLKDKVLYERDYLKLDEIITPMLTAFTATKEEVGASKVADDSLSDSGTQTRESGSNDARK